MYICCERRRADLFMQAIDGRIMTRMSIIASPCRSRSSSHARLPVGCLRITAAATEVDLLVQPSLGHFYVGACKSSEAPNRPGVVVVTVIDISASWEAVVARRQGEGGPVGEDGVKAINVWDPAGRDRDHTDSNFACHTRFHLIGENCRQCYCRLDEANPFREWWTIYRQSDAPPTTCSTVSTSSLKSAPGSRCGLRASRCCREKTDLQTAYHYLR